MTQCETAKQKIRGLDLTIFHVTYMFYMRPDPREQVRCVFFTKRGVYHGRARDE